MKIYNKRGFFSGIGEFVLAAACGVTIVITGFDWKLAVLGVAAALFGIVSISSSLSREMTQQDRIEEKDERTNYVELKAKARTSDFISCLLFIAAAASLIAYGITKNQGYVFMFLGTIVPLFICWIGYIVFRIYYEKHE